MNPEHLSSYLLSLPERVVRSTAAVAAGLARELGDVTVPSAIRRTRLYQSMVDSFLRFLIEQVGEVEGAYPPEGRLAQEFALRRAAGNGIEMLGVLAFRASPVWVMAALADLSGAGRVLITEICESLKEEGLLDPQSNFESVDQMLDGLEKFSGLVAEAINTPPLNVVELRKEWEEIRREARKLPDSVLPTPGLLRSYWRDLRREAVAQGRSVFEVSSLLAVSAITRLPENVLRVARSGRRASQRTGKLLAGALLDHYVVTLREIHQTGYLSYFIREMRPYFHAAAVQFSPASNTLTERLLRRLPAKAGVRIGSDR